MEIPEITAYRKRLEKEYEDLLSVRKGILKQVELDQGEADIARRNKEIILEENAKLIGEANRELADFKGKKEVFIKQLEDREKYLNNREKILSEVEEGLLKKVVVADTTKADYEVLINKTKVYEQTLKEKIKEAEDKRKKAESYEREAFKIYNQNKRDSELIDKVREELKRINSLFNKRIEKLILDEEALGKERETLNRERAILEGDKVHLYSQQQSLKLAYEEIKNYGNKDR
jgi:hypothetical protein